jgi:thiosulfate reductase / polysulfide reductase chain A
MSPVAAHALGLEPDQPVMVSNDHGDSTGPLPLKVTERMPDWSVYMVHGFGHDARRLRRAYRKGGNDTAVIRDYALDRIAGTTGMRTQFVRVRPAGPGKVV